MAEKETNEKNGTKRNFKIGNKEIKGKNKYKSSKIIILNKLR